MAEFPPYPPGHEAEEEVRQEAAKRPVKLLLLYKDPRKASYNYMAGMLAYSSDRTYWENSYLCLETKLGFVDWILGQLQEEPEEILLKDSNDNVLATGRSEIIRYLEAHKLSTGFSSKGPPVGEKTTKTVEAPREKTYTILTLEVQVAPTGKLLCRGVYWSMVENWVMENKVLTEHEKQELLKTLQQLDRLASSDPGKFQELRDRLLVAFYGDGTRTWLVSFTPPAGVDVKPGMLLEVPKSNIEREL